MKKTTKIKTITLAAFLAAFGFAGALASSAEAYNVSSMCTGDFHYDDNVRTCVPNPTNNVNLWDTIQTVINVILAIVGVIAVFMVIIGGIQYATSAGDPGKVKKAKDTILYGIIGLIIALLAFAIVNFVLTNVFQSGGSTNATGGGSGTTGP